MTMLVHIQQKWAGLSWTTLPAALTWSLVILICLDQWRCI
jgi:hypothetical protein